MSGLSGPGADENKSVRLADGRLILNVRAKGLREIAFSHDGGETWGPMVDDSSLVDPAKNGAIIRYAPNASSADPRSHILLCSNTDDPAIRRNLTLNSMATEVRIAPEPADTLPVHYPSACLTAKHTAPPISVGSAPLSSVPTTV